MIEKVIKFARVNKLAFEMVPVDDRSDDDTRKILLKMAKKYPQVQPVFRNHDGEEKGNTMGKTLIFGTKSAKGDIIIWTMGDLADDPSTYTDIIQKLNSGYDMVFGSRYMPGGSRGNLDLIKAFLSSWGTRLARLLFGIPVHDITNAFRGFRKVMFNNIILTSTGFSISPEFAIKAYLAGYRLSEVPTVYTNRVAGLSSFKLYYMTVSYLKLYFSLFIKYIILRQKHDFMLGNF